MAKAQKKTLFSIDEKHSDMMAEFHRDETVVIPELRDEISSLKATLQDMAQKDDNAGLIDKIMECRDQIVKAQACIQQLQQKKKNYLLQNSRYIFDYFEQKKQISNVSEPKQVNVLNSFFKIKSTSVDREDVGQSSTYAQSRKFYQQYWKNVNRDYLNPQDFVQGTDRCPFCETGEMVPQEEDGILICNDTKCSKFVMHMVDSAKPNNKEPPNEVSYTAYIRLNHFKEILSQFQAKETTQIPPEVIETIRARIKKERITDIKLINYDKMREILRKLGLNKYFEHIQFINSLFGIKPPVMTEELHETLCVLFIEIQQPWAIHCPPNRTNFFNYTYTLFQLCVLLDQTQYLPYIPMMKDRDKQLEQDMIWKAVCNDLDWEYFPTI
jgi:hypothetical protein